MYLRLSQTNVCGELEGTLKDQMEIYWYCCFPQVQMNRFLNLSKTQSLIFFLNKEQLPTLDVSVIYYTYKNTILLPNDFHAQCLKKGLPLSHLDHVNRICDSDENYFKYISEMMKHFTDDSQDWGIGAKTKQNKIKNTQKWIPVNLPTGLELWSEINLCNCKSPILWNVSIK